MSKIILGVDPGYGITGYGILQVNGSQMKCLQYGVITTPAEVDFAWRLHDLHNDLKKIIMQYKPNVVAVEELFFYKNVKTAINVGQARGVIMLTAMLAKLPVLECTPLQVKQAITGYGKADKSQVQQMVKNFLKLENIPKPDDAADALAVAIWAAHAEKLTKHS